MASLRKKYRVEESLKDAPPVATAPSVSVEAPPQAADGPELPQRPEDKDPVREAEQNAIALKQRLAEMEAAESLQQEALTQQQRLAKERPQKQQAMPAHVQAWIDAHPEFFQDQVKLAELQLATAKCTRDGLGWESPDFVPAVERHLGLRHEAHPNGNGHAHDSPPMPAPTPPRNPPVRQQHYGGPIVSAPPTREVPSMATGRVPSDVRLTADEADMARRLKISPEEYQRQKEKMIRLKQAGVIQDGR